MPPSNLSKNTQHSVNVRPQLHQPHLQAHNPINQIEYSNNPSIPPLNKLSWIELNSNGDKVQTRIRNEGRTDLGKTSGTWENIKKKGRPKKRRERYPKFSVARILTDPTSGEFWSWGCSSTNPNFEPCPVFYE